MNKRSVCKLQEAGYVFLRFRDLPGKEKPYAIMVSSTFGVWHILVRFDTRTARARRLQELEEDDHCLCD